MRRKMTDVLLRWKNDPGKVCLLIEGARQIGKTYIIDEFARSNYDYYAHLDFAINPEYAAIFDGSLETKDVLNKLSGYFPAFRAEKGRSMIFLDEIQRCPDARAALKPLAIDGTVDVVASGSLLGLNYGNRFQLPVGYEHKVSMKSMDFEEFLWAFGISEQYIAEIRDCIRMRIPLEESVLKRMEHFFTQYMLTGGMPKAILTLFATNSLGAVRDVQQDILNGYRGDVMQYAPVPIKTKVAKCFDSIPAQLSRRSKKFRFTDVENRKNVGVREYEDALEWLFDAGIISFCRNMTQPAQPLMFNIRDGAFKVYMNDTGLLMCMLGQGPAMGILNEDRSVNEGAAAENIVGEMLSKNGYPLLYYEKKGKMEIDFILDPVNTLTAVEVKSGSGKISPSMETLKKSVGGIGRWIMFENSNIFVDAAGTEHYPIFCAAFIDSMYEVLDVKMFPPI
ncbi:MAG: AAA family ATPase [Candidatus Methanoplasma sp.]|jgi:predicted AAA+ superfamily ATPase|nr:AAA family ATPase [Candidatus Methanoplasma sp.]